MPGLIDRSRNFFTPWWARLPAATLAGIVLTAMVSLFVPGGWSGPAKQASILLLDAANSAGLPSEYVSAEVGTLGTAKGTAMVFGVLVACCFWLAMSFFAGRIYRKRLERRAFMARFAAKRENEEAKAQNERIEYYRMYRSEEKSVGAQG